MKRVALIGLGMVADTHVAALRDAKGVQLCGVMGRTKGKARAFADKAAGQIGGPIRVYRTAKDVADDPDVDFAIIATPPDARRDIVACLSAAGKPLLLEKPIERTLDAAAELVALCEADAVPMAVVFQHRARKASKALRDAVAQGVLGRIVAAEIRVPWWRDQSYYDAPGRGTYARDGGGVLLTQAIHTLDLALWILGPVARVQALLRTTATHQLEAENWAGALFETSGGCVGTLTATTAAYPGGSETIALHGTQGSASLEAGVLSIQTHDGRQISTGENAETGGGADPMAFTHDWHQTVIEDFASSLTGGHPPLTTGRDGLMVHRMIDAMERAQRSGQWQEVSVP